MEIQSKGMCSKRGEGSHFQRRGAIWLLIAVQTFVSLACKYLAVNKEILTLNLILKTDGVSAPILIWEDQRLLLYLALDFIGDFSRIVIAVILFQKQHNKDKLLTCISLALIALVASFGTLTLLYVEIWKRVKILAELGIIYAFSYAIIFERKKDDIDISKINKSDDSELGLKAKFLHNKGKITWT